MLKEMAFFAYHGLYASEREQGNMFWLTVKAIRELPDDTEFDHIDSTTDYEKIYKLVVPHMYTPEDLLEQVLVKMARSIRGAFKDLSALELTLKKNQPPMGKEVKASEVTLSFSYI